MIRFVSFACLIFTALMFPWWVFAVFTLVYIFVWTTPETLLLSVCIDALFGDPYVGVWYRYTLMTILFLIVAAYAKPHVRMYT